MPDGSFPVEIVKGMPVVAAPEEIDITNAEALRAALLEVAVNGPDTLVVDMTRTQFCDSSGLHTLLAAHKRAQAEGGELLLVIPAAPVLRIFAITGVDRIIPNFTSLDQALTPTSANGSAGRRRAASAPGAANRTGSTRSTPSASLTEKPADPGTCVIPPGMPELG